MLANNFPTEINLGIRRGSTFGPVVVVFSGFDLTTYDLEAGVDGVAIRPTLTVKSATELEVVFSHELTGSLRPSIVPSARAGRHSWWVDAKRRTDGVIVPLLAGVLAITPKGGMGA